MKEKTREYIEGFYKEHPEFYPLRAEIARAVAAISSVKLPNKIMTCGNGGSFSDAGHIVGELMKSFRCYRPLDDAFLQAYASAGGLGADRLESGIPAVVLGESSPLATAVINDIGGEWVFAQQAFVLGAKGDVLIGISTSGNSETVCRAMEVAAAKGITTIALTGETGGAMKSLCDILLNVPARETYRVQELHLPLYHLLCAAAELEHWENEKG